MSAGIGLEAEQENRGERKPKPVPVTVNRRPVELPDRKVTGLEVKEAAVAQGVAIDVGFQLSVRDKGRYQVLGDADGWRARPDDEFLAVAPDDNS